MGVSNGGRLTKHAFSRLHIGFSSTSLFDLVVDVRVTLLAGVVGRGRIWRG